LVTREQRQQQQLRDFAEVILSNSEVVLSWQSEVNGEHNAASPWIEQLNLMLARHQQAILQPEQRALPVHELAMQTLVQPRPSAAALKPATLSSSGLSSLMACPYQFFASRLLKLSALDELSDMPEKRDYGDWLHAILKDYHDHIQVEQLPLNDARVAILQQISEERFKRVLKQNPAALGFSVRWAKVIPAYVAWANQREQDGWLYHEGEAWAERVLQWQENEETCEITLRGRIDRMDIRQLDDGSDAYAVLDYKTKRLSELKTRLKTYEDQQLPFYGLLAQDKGDEAHYVALEMERDAVGDASADNYAVWKDELEKLIKKDVHAISQGAALPAHGIESACQYCEMRGLCRKGAW
jgi:ATP-dependent helicase/nuclease subunit B